MNKMLIAMVVIFGISWLPINLLLGFENLASDIVDLSCWELYYLFYFIVHVVAMSSACYNPFFYGLLNTAFKTEFSNLCSCGMLIPPANTERQDEKQQGGQSAGEMDIEDRPPSLIEDM